MDHSNLMELLYLKNTDDKDIRIIQNLYYEKTAVVRVGNEITEWTKIATGVRQGCVLSPDLYNLYSEIVFCNIQHLDGITIGGTNINNIRYADDTALLATSENKLQELIDQVVFHSENYGIAINTKKTECVVITKSQSIPMRKIKIAGITLKQVEKFKYLESWITSDARCHKDVRTRIAISETSLQNTC